MPESNENKIITATSLRLKVGLAEMLKGGVIMDVMNVEQARIAEEAGATSVMALERVPAMQLKAKGLKRHYPDPGVLRALDGNGTLEPRTTDPETKAASSAGSHPPAVYNEA